MSLPDITNPATLKHLLAQVGASPSISMGQNFLISPEVVQATLAILAEGPKHITELGSGMGALTQALIESGYTVRAIEKDDDFVEILPRVVSARYRPNLEIIHGDLKKVTWEQHDHYQLVGNIPYNLSGFIFRRMTQLAPVPSQATFLVQREVATRVCANAPHMNLLALSVQLWGSTDIIVNVPPSCFWPQPKVSSALVTIHPHPTQLSPSEHEHIMRVANIAFSGKRKQIQKQLRDGLDMDTKDVHTALKSADIDPIQRPQELSLDQWKILAHSLPV